MSKKKLLIREVFEKVRIESPKDTKSGWADDLSDDLEKKFNFIISGKTLSRYYDSFVAETKKETGIETIILDKLSQYIGYKNFKDYCQTFEKKIEGNGESTASMKFLLDGEEISVPEKIFNIIIKITNNPNFNIPDFMKKNGLGVLEFVFVALLVTGGVVFTNPTERNKRSGLGFFNSHNNLEKRYMYWDGKQFNPTDSSYISPEIEVIALDQRLLKYQRRITRKDTMTVENSLGRTWYSKYNGDVEFFTADGIDPNNKRELKKASAFIINKYAGPQHDSIEVE